MDNNQEVISKLKFIGRINKGEKLNTNGVFIQPDDVFTKISRTLYNKDNRTKTLAFIKNVVDRSFEITDTLSLESSKEQDLNVNKFMVSNILSDLRQSKTGIQNMKETYSSDIKFCCDLDTILQDIDARLIKYTNM